MDERIILKNIAEKKEQLVDTLCKLIAIPTANPPSHFYREFVDYMAKLLEAWGIEHHIVEIPGGPGERPAIIGSYGEGNAAIHFHGHYDVVPAYTPDQFKPYIKDNCVYGRGSADMKSGILAMLYAIHTIKETGIALKNKITFSIVPDEETGGKFGTEYLFNAGLMPQIPFLGMIMPEPTGNTAWNASKGALTYEIEIKGKFAHVGLAHQGENSFEHMVTLANDILKLKKKITARKTKLPVYPAGAGRSTMVIGGQSGSGVNFNIVPEKSFFTIDRRFNPEETLAEAKQEINEIIDRHKQKGMRIESRIMQETASSFSSPGTPIGKVLAHAIADVTGKEPLFILCPGVCEIRFFSGIGVPAFAYGPGLLEDAHSPNEHVNIDNIMDCAKVYALTALRLS
ncbi:MAG: ArgE/DapE family deacylase [Acidobacteria bacterium]|jgi:succinyl-diaminopimelate desuccinylase|nr:ArgE/DapE family deacylase [Acidobacteriota bacterium]